MTLPLYLFILISQLLQGSTSPSRVVNVQGHWSVVVPAHFKDSAWYGFDTQFGTLYSDSLRIRFEWGGLNGKYVSRNKRERVNCYPDDEYKLAIESWKDTYYTDHYGNDSFWTKQHDTIERRMALFVFSADTAKYSHCFIRECENTGFIEFAAMLQNEQQRKTFMEVCRSVKFLLNH